MDGLSILELSLKLIFLGGLNCMLPIKITHRLWSIDLLAIKSALLFPSIEIFSEEVVFFIIV
jgi:hypothetical protein